MPRDDPARYRPGHRSRPQARGDGKMSENRAAWVKTVIGQFVLMLDPPTADSPEQVGTDVRMFHPRPGARPVSFNFTALTEEELDAVEQFFKLVIDTARPVCKTRDKVAQDALNEGDDSHARVYREAPQFIVRERSLAADGQGLRVGLERVSQVDEAPRAANGGVRGDSDGLAEQPEGHGSPEDDGS